MSFIRELTEQMGVRVEPTKLVKTVVMISNCCNQFIFCYTVTDVLLWSRNLILLKASTAFSKFPHRHCFYLQKRQKQATIVIIYTNLSQKVRRNLHCNHPSLTTFCLLQFIVMERVKVLLVSWSGRRMPRWWICSEKTQATSDIERISPSTSTAEIS